MKTNILKEGFEKQIIDKLNEIEEVIDREWRNVDAISLMTGLSGIPLFYAQMDRWTNSKSRIGKVYNIIEVVFDELNSGNFIMTYSSGIIGVAFMVNLLKKEGVIDESDVEDNLEFLDNLIIERSLEPFSKFEHIDFLHGRLGAANYFLERSIPNGLQQRISKLFHNIADVVNQQVEMSRQVADITEFDELAHRTNCGLAHGHISVILVFSKYLTFFPKDEVIINALNNSIDCVLSFRSKDNNTLASFPGIAVNQKTALYDIPLGWCYGDQTIAYGLSIAADIIGSESLAKVAHEIAERTLRRDTFEKAFSKNSDAGFCHGASSLAYLHKIFYRKYQDEKFLDLYKKFTGVTLAKGNDPLGLAGYQKYLGNNVYEPKIGLLDGVVGIGLFLLDSVMDKEKQVDWQSCFLLE